MCCFSRPVAFVADTSIFARGDGSDQLLAYAMRVGASEDVAMVLPLPVPAACAENAVEFIDMSTYPSFFEDLAEAFPRMTAPLSRGGPPEATARAQTLRVQRVGDFEASFVPSIADFARLDARFRLPARVWDQLPQYRDWGFAVFKLRARKTGLKALFDKITGGSVLSRAFHPMAFRFPRRDPSAVYFPTTHVHDGSVHATAVFGHRLYLQHAGDLPDGTWLKSDGPLSAHLRIADSAGIPDAARPAFQKILLGTLPNQDTYVRS